MNTLRSVRTTLLVAAVSSLFGCAGIVREMEQQQALYQKGQAMQRANELARSPFCTSEEECRRMMGAAQVWVASRSNFRFEIANDNLIRTYSDGSDYWYTVTRTPVGGGHSRIVLTTGIRGNSNLYSEFALFVQNGETPL